MCQGTSFVHPQAEMRSDLGLRVTRDAGFGVDSSRPDIRGSQQAISSSPIIVRRLKRNRGCRKAKEHRANVHMKKQPGCTDRFKFSAECLGDVLII